MEDMEDVLLDFYQFVQHPPLHHHLQYIQRSHQHRARLPDQFIQLVSVPGSESAAPADSSKEYYT